MHPQRDGDAVDPDKAFCFLPRLEAVLRQYPHVEIVISSTWRNQFTFDELKVRFSEDLRSRIVGVTPNIDGECWQPLLREREILAWLQQHHRETDPWVALDDAVWQFHDYSANLVPCTWYVGFDGEAERLLHARLAANCLCK